jgi:hypothetical protein
MMVSCVKSNYLQAATIVAAHPAGCCCYSPDFICCRTGTSWDAQGRYREPAVFWALPGFCPGLQLKAETALGLADNVE